MSMNELEKIWNKGVSLSYREKIKEIEDYLIEIADGDNVVGNGKEIIYPEHLWKYKHSFANGVYIREMQM